MDAETFATLRHVLQRQGRDVDQDIFGAAEPSHPGKRLHHTLAAHGRSALALSMQSAGTFESPLTGAPPGVAPGPATTADDLAEAIVSIPPHTSCAFLSRLTPPLHHVWVRATLADGVEEQVMFTGATASSMRRVPCLDQGMCCASHFPAEARAAAAASASVVPAAVQRAAVATAEAAFRASARGATVFASEYRGLYAEMNITELCVRSHGPNSNSKGSREALAPGSPTSAGIVADLHRAVSEDLRQMATHSHTQTAGPAVAPEAAAGSGDAFFDAEAEGAGASVDSPGRMATPSLPSSASPPQPVAAAAAAAAKPIVSELDMLDAQCMLGILERSAAAMQPRAATAVGSGRETALATGFPGTLTLTPASEAAAGAASAGLDVMVATATVSLFIDSAGQILVEGRSCPGPSMDSASGGSDSRGSSATGPEDISAAARPDPPAPEPLPADDSLLLAALRPTLRTGFASLAQLRLRKGSLWLPFARRVAGNLLLVEALQQHAALPRLQADSLLRGGASSTAAHGSPSTSLLEYQLGAGHSPAAELRRLLLDACALERRIASHRAAAGTRVSPADAARAAAALAARPSWTISGPRLVAETRPMILSVCKRDDITAARRRGAAAKAGEVVAPAKPLATQTLLLPLAEVMSAYFTAAAAASATGAAPCVFSVAVPLPDMSLTCRVIATVTTAESGLLAYVQLAVDSHATSACESVVAASGMGVPLFLSKTKAELGHHDDGGGRAKAAGHGGGEEALTEPAFRAHAGLSLLPPAPLRVVCLAKLGSQLADVQVELRAQPHF